MYAENRSQYKTHHVKKVLFEPKLLPNQRVLVDKLPLTSSLNKADGMETVIYSKFQPHKAGLLRIIIIQTHKAVIDQECVSRTVSIHWKTAAPELNRNNSAHERVPARQSDSSQAMSDTWCQQSDQTLGEKTSKASTQTEYAVRREVRRKDRGRKSVVLFGASGISPRTLRWNRQNIFPYTSFEGTKNEQSANRLERRRMQHASIAAWTYRNLARPKSRNEFVEDLLEKALAHCQR